MVVDAGGESLPPLEPGATGPVPNRFMELQVDATRWSEQNYAYVASFEKLFGERFEVRDSPPAARKDADFRRIEPGA